MSDFNTPMMKQYKEIKERYPDAFLFFRCGDFYELFGNDSIEASKILDITLTKRGDVPMCGVPYHAVDVYIGKMIKAGKKIAICEQMEDPKLVKGIVKRDVQEIITPGTLIEEKLLQNKSNNFLLSLNKKGLYLEFSYLDLSTGDFEVNEIDFTNDLSILKGELVRISPKEILIPENIWIENKNIRDVFEELENVLVNRFPVWYFEDMESRNFLFNHLKIKNWTEIGIFEQKTDLTTPGILFKYLKDNARGKLDHVRRLNFNSNKNIMILDETTIKNLELLKNIHDGTNLNSLLEVLDETTTSMGGRLLKKWIIEPLLNISLIKKRQDIVFYFFQNDNKLYEIELFLKEVMDLERLCSRIVMDKATPKDLVSIKHSLIKAKEVYEKIKNIPQLIEESTGFKNLDNLVDFIDKAIKEEPATYIDDGNIVKDGYNLELDKLKELSFKSKEYITKIELAEREKFNTPSLRIKYNKIIGYFFEISKLQSKNLPDNYILRQSLVNVSRYTNKELSEYESKVLTARDEINKIEEDIFNEVKNKVLENIPEIQDNAKIIAELDVYFSFAKCAVKNHYTKPEVNDSKIILIKEGRHPVIEKKLDVDEFIPNDLEMDNDFDFLHIITGPNMAGKSTYLRQNALIVLLAQIGSFVPAIEAKIGIVDRIFTRIGTSDNLSRGQSTFLVEMTETANILRNATDRSLIIMDEIGRGTSTYDGLSIAWSILEYVSNKKYLGAKTLFATHYHELTVLSEKDGIANYSIGVSEENGNITFLHKIIDKPAEKSYGIHVAKLASLPEEVLVYAELILNKLEEKQETKEKINISGGQLELFNIDSAPLNKKHNEILEEIKFMDINRITPIQALNILSDLQKKLKK